MIVLDTNVLSELMRPAPHTDVVAWFARRAGLPMFTTTITEAEILYGIAILDPGPRRAGLDAAARAMFADDFDGRILPFDRGAADGFARIAALRRRAGRPIAHADAQIAAICASRGAALATRNLKDFEGCEITVLNPWDA